MFEGIPTFKATIYNWEIKRFNSEYHVIEGFTSKGMEFNTSIRTSYIELLNLKEGWVKTRNSFYALGAVNDEKDSNH